MKAAEQRKTDAVASLAELLATVKQLTTQIAEVWPPSSENVCLFPGWGSDCDCTSSVLWPAHVFATREAQGTRRVQFCERRVSERRCTSSRMSVTSAVQTHETAVRRAAGRPWGGNGRGYTRHGA